jgi:hypothetical protein
MLGKTYLIANQPIWEFDGHFSVANDSFFETARGNRSIRAIQNWPYFNIKTYVNLPS